MTVFGPTYADAYDLFYSAKDYEAECDVIESMFRHHAEGTVESVLDLGCGTGNHAFPLAHRGFHVTGVDRSDEMLSRAIRKAATFHGTPPHFSQGDVTTMRLGKTFDVAVMMFAVLGYQTENHAVLETLRTVRTHLKPGGLFIFDVWYGPAVLQDRPQQRVRQFEEPGGQVLRVASGSLHVQQQTCTVAYDVWRIADDKVVERSHESHEMRYFFPQELQLFLDVAGFHLVRLGQFPNVEDAPDESNWNVSVVARAR